MQQARIVPLEPGLFLNQLSTSVGWFIGFDDQDRPLVSMYSSKDIEDPPQRALLASELTREQLEQAAQEKRMVLICHPEGVSSPIIIGIIRDSAVSAGELPEVLDLSAKEEVLIRVGRSWFRLRADGRIELRGDSISSRARILNKIKGAAVRIN
jgi:hypothetical protein